MNLKTAMFTLFVILPVICLLISPVSARKFDPWFIAFETGLTKPTEDFNRTIDDDTVYGLNVEYLSLPYLGVRVAYKHHEFEYDFHEAKSTLEIDSLSISALASYSFPRWVRLFAMIGPTYYSADGQEGLNWGDDEKDIGWSGGGGFEFYPIKNWGIRFQSIYNSAEIGDRTPRASWVDTTIGLTFRF